MFLGLQKLEKNLEMDNGMVGVLRETSMRGGVPPCPPLPNQLNSRVIVVYNKSRLASFRERVRSSHITTLRKLLGSPLSRAGNRYNRFYEFIMGLTNKVGGSLPLHLRAGTKRSVTLIAADKVGLITGLGSKPLTWPINLERDRDLCLNPTSFLGIPA